MILSRSVILVVAVALALSACGRGGRDVQLTKIKKTGNGPDEFTVLPTKPLQAPDSYNTLPAPTPGTSNLVDTNPEAEGIAALGGNPNALVVTGVGAADGALLNRARRYGVTGDIRQTLASEDLDVRRRHGRVNILNIGPNDDYTDAYKRQWLDSQAEQRRLRSMGVAVPSAPPPS
ncbi:DUF3035 domain-containing protein [Roseovarius pelagicus]|uniref:DUF3035 domain-containing protein n=1 Tax=Roseovarius pelagicus TaxID=2980108 RepID=A0ABY6D711_9RHOB|nr:DUF3035 domain-containing protein [Roseovarius pelagicus]UXX81936.1 DUF3035 domain-containing protein [Roseovarius pelagicus]